MSEIAVHHGDSREVLKTLADNSIAAVVCDPPYALVSIGKRFGAENAAPCKAGKTGAYQRASSGFMGKKWDTGETAFDPDFWREVWRVMKPGAHLAAFGGTRSYHRLACAIEDAGFEVRDMVSWNFGSGFPKSHDVSKGIDKAAGAKREVIGPGRWNSVKGDNANQSDCLIRPGGKHDETAPATDEAAQWEGWGTALKPAFEPICLARKPLSEKTIAANVLRWGTGALNIDASRIGLSVGDDPRLGGKGDWSSDKMAAHVYEGGYAGVRVGSSELGRWPANVCHDGSDEVVGAFPSEAGGSSRASNGRRGKTTVSALGDGLGTSEVFHADAGSAARFFYSSKADAEDRLGSKHPTVKPVDLMRWLCTLITPLGGTILDPFAGTGTTGLAAMGAGFDAILIEREAEYIADIERRIAWAKGEGRLTAQETSRKLQPDDHGPLFAESAA